MHKRGSFMMWLQPANAISCIRIFARFLSVQKNIFEEKKVGFYKKMQHTGYLRHLLVRRAIKTGEILVDLITTTQTDTFEGTEEALYGDGRSAFRHFLWREALRAFCIPKMIHWRMP